MPPRKGHLLLPAAGVDAAAVSPRAIAVATAVIVISGRRKVISVGRDDANGATAKASTTAADVQGERCRRWNSQHFLGRHTTRPPLPNSSISIITFRRRIGREGHSRRRSNR